MPRPIASAEARVFTIQSEDGLWGTLVDERIRYKTLFEPGSDLHEDLDEIIVPIEGRYWVRVGSWARTLVPGEAALIPRGVPHDSGTATNLVGTRILVLLFNKEMNVLGSDQAGGRLLPPGALSWLKGAFRFLRLSPNLSGFKSVENLPEFLREIAVQQELSGDKTHPDPMVSEMIKLLETPDAPTLEELSRHFGLSSFHLQKRFKQAVGFSPLQHAIAWKLDAIASEIASGSSMPLIELATEYGFNDIKHFRELFQRRFGISPSAYRKNPPPQNK